MGRRYDRSDEERLLSAVHRLFPGASVGADIIAGFPGETEDEFAETLSLAESGLLSYLHVFPYSRRPGTPAAALKGLHTEVVTERANILRSRSELLRRRFRESMIGERGIILVEGRRHRNRRVGLTDNYIPVAAPPGAVEGELVEVTLGSSNICWDLR
jgi:threonylcarbamoyladenosine tRNA methylthiotransferase MtaB